MKKLSEQPLPTTAQVLQTEAEREALTAYLGGFLTAARRERIEEVMARRTRHLTVVLEDLFQPHNGSAVLRSCECFGIQEVHVIEEKNCFKVSPSVALGAGQWLTVRRWKDRPGENLRACLADLRDRGYRLAATALTAQAMPIANVPLDQPLAVLFGTEISGLTAEALAMADFAMHIPMTGFTQSFNVSVSAALCLYELAGRARREGHATGLTELEKQVLRLDWYRASLPDSAAYERRYLQDRAVRPGTFPENPGHDRCGP